MSSNVGNSELPAMVRINPLQRRIVLLGALMLGIAILFPPWSSSGGSPAGYHFLFLPLTRKVVYRVNSSLLCLEIVGIALITWFSFIAARHVSLSARIVII